MPPTLPSAMRLRVAAPMFAGHLATHGRYAGSRMNPAVFVRDEVSGAEVAVMSLAKGVACAVVDMADYERVTSQCTWTFSDHLGYAINTSADLADGNYMHMVVLPSAHGLTIDHINQIRTDNRLANLRTATQSEQNANRAERVDRFAVPPELAEAGIRSMPRYVRYDRGMGRFTFNDHPVLRLLPDTAAFSGGNGTRHSGCSLLGKYLDSARKYVRMHEQHPALLARMTKGGASTEDARRMATEYVTYTAFANALHPELFPAPPRIDVATLYVDDLQLARAHVAQLEASGTDVRAGAANQRAQIEDVAAGGAGLAATRTKGNRATLFDAAHRAVIEGITCDESGSTPRVRLDTGERVWLGELMWTTLMRAAAPPAGHVIVPLNWEHYDVRLENMIALPGESGKNYKRPEVLDVPEELREGLGMRFIPRGVMLSRERGVLSKVKVSVGGAKAVCAPGATVLERLQTAIDKLRAADPGFDELNDRYQRMMDDWREATGTQP